MCNWMPSSLLGQSPGSPVDLISEYGREGRGFVALQDGIDTTTSGGHSVFHIMAALVEFERDLISKKQTTSGGNL
jgi:DNA invertase Pin-like site-specific DNA recombinase